MYSRGGQIIWTCCRSKMLLQAILSQSEGSSEVWKMHSAPVSPRWG